MAIPSWLHFSQVSGNGDTTITVTADTNNGDYRSYQSTVSGQELTKTVSVTQSCLPESTPLSFKILNSGVIKWRKGNNQDPSKTIQYQLNDGEWTTIRSSSITGTQINVQLGDTLRFRGNEKTYDGAWFDSTVEFEVYGNIMSLISSTNYPNVFDFVGEDSYSTFDGLFSNCQNITDAGDLVLPATGLSYRNYVVMFAGCSKMKTAPKILPAPILVQNCYDQMFNGCSSLETAPILPAESLVANCYSMMFFNCSKLNYIKCFAKNGLFSSNTLTNWVYKVASTGTFVKNPSASWRIGASGIPSGWTITTDVQTRGVKSVETGTKYASIITKDDNWIIG